MIKRQIKHIVFKFILFSILITLIIFAIFFKKNEYITNFIIFVQNTGFYGKCLFALIYILATITVMPGMPLALAAGFIYGCFNALFIIVPASIFGGAISFLIGRYLFRNISYKFIKKFSNFNLINISINKHGFFIIFLLFSYPLTPFRLLNYALSTTKLKFRSFIFSLICSMIPHMFPYVYLGSLLSGYDEIVNGTFYKILIKNPVVYFSWIFCSIIFVLILSLIIKKIIKFILASNKKIS